MIGMVFVVTLSIHLVADGLAGSQRQEFAQNILIEKSIPPGAIPAPLDSPQQPVKDRTIFSKTTIISLFVAVIGIVAFRRNSYS
jgi:hypothetical protein